MKNSKKIIIVSIIIVVIILVNQCTNNLKRNIISEIKKEEETTETIKYDNEYKKTPEFDINNLPVTDEDQAIDYINFLAKYVKPDKLSNFINVNHHSVTFFKSSKNGYEVIEKYIKKDAYKELFNHLFQKDMSHFDDCPVTVNFKFKFKNGVYDYYKLDDKYEYIFETLLDNNMFRVDASSYELDEYLEPKFRYRINYEYKFDSEGNVDDIIFIKEEHSY